MNTKQLLGFIGSLVLCIGVFTPIMSIPMMGNLNYFQNGEGDGAIVLILAVISLVLVSAKKYNGLWFTGVISLLIMLFTLVNFQSKKEDMASEFAGNGLDYVVMQSFQLQLQWGWGLLVVGAALVISSAAFKE